MEIQAHPLPRVAVVHAAEAPAHGDPAAQLLQDLAAEGLFGPLPLLDLPAGELPFAGQVAAPPAAGDQDLVGAEDHGRDDGDGAGAPEGGRHAINRPT